MPGGAGDSTHEPLAERLRRLLGESVDPEVTLPEEEGSVSDSTSDLVKRLEAHGLKQTRYRLKGEVARGGMGAILKVWDEDLRRNLAMKVVLGKEEAEGATTDQIDAKTLGRFLEEAQVTGQLDHPGVVPVHELGLDEEGRIYFTMRLVKGRDLKQVFDLAHEEKEGWNLARALGVLLKVCEAMSYAHARGVIHRDLKPANVMVGRYGEVYVMDWGIARVLGREDDKDLRVQVEPGPTTGEVRSDRRDRAGETPDSPLYTMDGDVVGTPAYMSPEQATGRISEMGPPSDVYALGAMLYHLLAGHMPYVPPGARLNNYAVWSHVQSGPPAPLHEAAPDAPPELVAICERAMAREAADRYRDTSELAADLAAFLELRVVSAYETGAWAEARKWVRRNKPLAAALAAAVVLLLVGLATALYLREEAQRNFELAERRREEAESQRLLATQAAERERLAAAAAEDQRRLAQTRADELEEVSNFQVEQLLAMSPERMGTEIREAVLGALPEEDRSEMRDRLFGVNFTTVAAASLGESIVQPTITAIDNRFRDQPLVRAQLLHSAALALNNLGRDAEAVEPHRHALEIHREELGPDDEGTLFSLVVLGQTLANQGEFEEAEPLLAQALETSRRVFGEDHPVALAALQAWGTLLHMSRRLDEAAPVFRQLVEAAERGLGPAGVLDAGSFDAGAMFMVGAHCRASGELDEAERYLRLALESSRARSGPRDGLTSLIANNLGELLLQKGEVEEAGQLLDEAQAELEQLFGEEHLVILTSAGNRGLMFMQLGRYEEAEASFRRAYEGYRATLGDDHRQTLMVRGNLGAVFFRRGELDEAEVHLRAAFDGFRNLIGEPGEATVTNQTHLSAVLCDSGQYEEAEQLARDAARNGEQVPGWSRDHWRTAEARSHRGEALVCLERYDEAEPILLEAYETLERRIPRSRRQRTLARTATALVALYRATDLPDEVARWQAILEEL